MSRATELVELAAAAMAEGSDPFHGSFLSEHEVTLDEVYDLGETLANAARFYLQLRRHPDWLAVLAVESVVGPEVAAAFEDSLGMARATRRLKEIGHG